MISTTEFINNEKNSLGKVYSDITYAINEISPYLEKSTIDKRRYFSYIEVLDSYIDLLTEKEFTSKGKKFNLFKKDDTISILNNFKRDHIKEINQLTNCSKCSCLNCIKECNFKSCFDCKSNSYIRSCDKDRLNIRFFDDFILDLTNDNTNEDSRYKVLATFEDCQNQKRYIALENLFDCDDKFILHYYPKISSDEYGEITDMDEFNFIVEAFDRL